MPLLLCNVVFLIWQPTLCLTSRQTPRVCVWDRVLCNTGWIWTPDSSASTFQMLGFITLPCFILTLGVNTIVNVWNLKDERTKSGRLFKESHLVSWASLSPLASASWVLEFLFNLNESFMFGWCIVSLSRGQRSLWELILSQGLLESLFNLQSHLAGSISKIS